MCIYIYIHTYTYIYINTHTYIHTFVAQLCPALCNPMNCSPLGSSVHGILQARILEWVAIPFSRGSSWPRDWTCVSCNSGRFFTIWATREAPYTHTHTHTHTRTICIPIHTHTLSTTYHPPRRSLERDAYSGDICCWKQHFQLNILKALGTNILKSSQRKNYFCTLGPIIPFHLQKHYETQGHSNKEKKALLLAEGTVEEFTCHYRRCKKRWPGSIPGLGSSLGVGNGNPLQYTCLENSMDRGA